MLRLSRIAGTVLPSSLGAMTKRSEWRVSNKKPRPRPANEPSTDDRLMSAFRRGEVDAAEAMFLRFAPLVFGIGVRTFHDPDLAAELVEDAFVRLWRRAPFYASSSAPLDTWVLRHALGVALQMCRSPVAGPGDAGSIGGWRADAESTGGWRADAEPVRPEPMKSRLVPAESRSEGGEGGVGGEVRMRLDDSRSRGSGGRGDASAWAPDPRPGAHSRTGAGQGEKQSAERLIGGRHS